MVPAELKTMLPVDEEPSVSVCAFVVPRTPDPVRYAALLPLFADIDAVGVPLFTLVNANFADCVVVPPRRRSCPVNLSTIAPFASLNGDPPLPTGKIPVISFDPPAKLTADEESTPVAFECTTPVERLFTRTLPVLASPRVSDCFAVVAIVPSAVKNVAPLTPPDTDAVGVPEFTLSTANFADDEDCPPIEKSTVELRGESKPFA